jgi:hypothetical protein
MSAVSSVRERIASEVEPVELDFGNVVVDLSGNRTSRLVDLTGIPHIPRLPHFRLPSIFDDVSHGSRESGLEAFASIDNEPNARPTTLSREIGRQVVIAYAIWRLRRNIQ